MRPNVMSDVLENRFIKFDRKGENAIDANEQIPTTCPTYDYGIPFL